MEDFNLLLLLVQKLLFCPGRIFYVVANNMCTKLKTVPKKCNDCPLPCHQTANVQSYTVENFPECIHVHAYDNEVPSVAVACNLLTFKDHNWQNIFQEIAQGKNAK